MIYLSYESHVAFAAPILKFKLFFFFLLLVKMEENKKIHLEFVILIEKPRNIFSPLKYIEELFKCKITLIPFFTNWNAYPLLRTLLSLWINFV